MGVTQTQKLKRNISDWRRVERNQRRRQLEGGADPIVIEDSGKICKQRWSGYQPGPHASVECS